MEGSSAPPVNTPSSQSTTVGAPSSHQAQLDAVAKSTQDLNNFLGMLDNYKPTIPEAVVKYYMETRGGTVTDPRVLKFVSLATDKFIAEIIHESQEQSLLKMKNPNNKRKLSSASSNKDDKVIVDTIDIYDLEGSLAQQHVHWRRSQRQKTAAYDTS